MIQNVIRDAIAADPLARLADPTGFMGWVYAVDYESALVMTNDLWKEEVGGVPLNAFLTAAPFLADTYAETPTEDRYVVLLRVTGAARLPLADDLVATRIDHFQRQTDRRLRAFDAITQNQLQHHGLQCSILGTFFVDRGGDLRLGSDIESFAAAGSLNVFRPSGGALESIVNYQDEDVRRRAAADLAAIAAAGDRATDEAALREMRFRLGTVRYTSTDRLHRSALRGLVPVYFQAADFLARRTAVFGMTRSGKSNTVKHLVAAVNSVANELQSPIGQLLFDLRGEYASANVQDRDAAGQAASLADAYPGQVVRYRVRRTPGFEMILNNFYEQLTEGLSIIHEVIREDANTSAGDVQTFLNMSLDEPDRGDVGLHRRWEVKVGVYRALLAAAGFDAPNTYRIRFSANAEVRRQVDAWYQDMTGAPANDPTGGLTPPDAIAWFKAARRANRELHPSLAGAGIQAGPSGQLRSSSGGDWLDAEGVAMLNMIVQRNANDAFIRGLRVLDGAREYHSPDRTVAVESEIYEHLSAGKIVIIDLSVGPAFIRERVSGRVATHMFSRSQDVFLRGQLPPTILVYVEEAHNLISKKAELTETWPTIAKEGAKFRIGLVYATQEPSSIHPNILSNTENWVVTHLNNDDELRVISKFYDFADFAPSLKRATDVGFARVRTLSGKFVIPVQVDKFEPGSAGAQNAESLADGEPG